jgi:hypothetical protein
MVKLQILTQWEQHDEPEQAIVFLVWQDLLDTGLLIPGDSITDQPTEQPAHNIVPEPNVVVVECRINQAAYDWLINSQKYGPGAILWSVNE